MRQFVKGFPPLHFPGEGKEDNVSGNYGELVVENGEW